MRFLCSSALLAVLLTGCFSVSTNAQTAPAQAKTGGNPEEAAVWRQFVANLKADKIKAEDLRPYYENLRAPALQWFAQMRQGIDWDASQTPPEVYRVGNQLHFVVTLALNGGGKTTRCFSFISENGKWYYQHMENIFIRLDQTGAPPVSVFPDVPDETKAWMREEEAVSKQVVLFNLLAKEKGKPFAYDWFKDGAGYFLAARVWVPFVPPRRAFILYACWEQANLRGNKVTLEALGDTGARIRMNLNYFELYEHAAHIRPQIAYEDYYRIFETIWQDRAKNAGWDLDLSCKGAECVFEFKRPAGQAADKT